MSWAFQPLLPAAQQLAGKAGSLTETVTAAENIQANIIAETARTETVTSQDTPLTANLEAPVSLTETQTSNESNDSVVLSERSVSESGTTTEEASGLPIYGGSLTETTTSTESSNNTLLAFGPAFEAGSGVPALNTLEYPNSYLIVSSIANSGGGSTDSAIGVTFVANKTGQLGKVLLPVSLSQTGTTVSQLGSVQLWQLASNSVSALPTTLLASIPFSLYSLPTDLSLSAEFNFSSISGATVTSGVAYAVVVQAGSDWVEGTTNFAYMRFNGWNASNQSSVHNFSRAIEKNYSNIWSLNTAGRFIQASVEYQNTAVEYYNGGFPQAVAITETGTPTEVSARTRVGVVYGLNKDSPLDVYAGKSYLIGTTIKGASYGRGARFKNTKADVLTTVGIPIYKIKYLDSTPNTTQGTVEVWTLASNALTALPSTQLATLSFNDTDIPNPISSLTSITNNVIGSAGLTQYVSTSQDDAAQVLTLPWSVNYLGKSYTTVYVVSNSYLTFGSSATTWSNATLTQPNVPKICIGVTDNSYQQVFAGTEGVAPNRTYRIRYEGSNGTTGVVGSPSIVWEMTFYENNISQIDIQVGTNARGAGLLYGIYSEDAFLGDLNSNITANVGYRLVSSTNTKDIASKDNITYFDFTPQNKVLVGNTGYMASVRAGSDWAFGGTKDYYGLYSVNTSSYIGNANGSTILAAQTLEGYNAATVSGPIAINSSSAWTSGTADTNYYTFKVDTALTQVSSDNQTYFAPISDSLSETLTSIDTLDTTRVFNIWETEIPAGDPFADALLGKQGTYTASTSTGNTGRGMTFIAENTGTLGIVYAKIGRVISTATVPTSKGTVQVWQLASNSITALPSTLLGSYDFSITELPTGVASAYSVITPFDLSSLGITLTQGVGYFVGWKLPADWITTTQQVSYGYYAVNAAGSLLQAFNVNNNKYKFLTLSLFTDAWSSGASSVNAYPFSVTLSNNTESALGGFASFLDMSDALTVSETQSNIVTLEKSIDETLTADETESNLVSFVGLSNETLSISDSADRLRISYNTTGEGSFWENISLWSSSANRVTSSTYGFTLTPTTSGILDRLKFSVDSNGLPAAGYTSTGTLTIYQNSGAGTILYTGPINYSDLSTGYNSISTIPLTTPLTINAGSTYYFTLSKAADWASNAFTSSYYTTTIPNFGATIANWSIGSGYANATTVYRIALLSSVALDNNIGGFTAPVDLTETNTASVTETTLVTFDTNLSETVAADETESNLVSFNPQITETGTSLDTLTFDRSALALELEGSAVVHITHNTTDAQNANSKSFLGFIYTPTTNVPLSTISLLLRQFNTAAATPTQPCTVELWQGVVSNQPQTLLKSVPYFIDTITTSVGGARYEFDFSDITLQAGQQYLIGHRVGSDVTISTKYPLIGVTTSNSGITNYLESLYPVIYKDLFASGSYQSRNNFGSLIAARVNTIGITDIVLGGFSAPVDLTETITQTDTYEYQRATSRDNTETLTAIETETTQVLFVSSLTETGSSSETQSNYILGVVDITETGNALVVDRSSTSAVDGTFEDTTASDNITNAISTTQLRTESVTASETETTAVLFVPSITESVSSSDSQFNIATRVASLTETGSSADSQLNSVLFVVSLTEAGSSSESITNVISTTQLRTESVTASETETTQVLFVSSLTETGSSADSQFNIATRVAANDETLTALDFEDNSVQFVTELTETGSGEDSISNVVYFDTYRLETLDPLDNYEGTYFAVGIALEEVSAFEESYNIASRVADIIEETFSVDLTESQVEFVSYLIEAITSSETSDNVITTYKDIIETLVAIDRHSNFAQLVSNVSELLEAYTSQGGQTGAYQEEFLTPDNSESSTVVFDGLITELIDPTDSATKQLILQALIEEFGLAEDILARWLIVALDYDIVIAQYAHVDSEYDHIYMDDLEVVYGNLPLASVEGGQEIVIKYAA